MARIMLNRNMKIGVLAAFMFGASALLLYFVYAATTSLSLEAEDAVNSGARLVDDQSASGGRYLQFATASAAPDTGTVPAGMPGEWSMVFQDEFNGTALDRQKWHDNRWFTNDCSEGFTQIPNEVHYFLGDNVSVSDGALHLSAKRENHTCTRYQSEPLNWTSGTVTTGAAADFADASFTPFSFQYGAMEARIKMPAGSGFWPAVWLLPASNYEVTQPEVDVVELYGSNPSEWTFNIHTPGCESNTCRGFFDGPDAAADFHTIGLLWQEDKIEWYVDGVKAHCYSDRETTDCAAVKPGSAFPREKLMILLNNSVDSSVQAATPSPGDFEVDYVRVWQ